MYPPAPIRPQMSAVLLTGHGGSDKLVYDELVAVPQPAMGEVLIRVLAAGINNTDINTRIGWYAATTPLSTVSDGSPDLGDWTGGGLTFPRIQGADACGVVARVGDGVDPARIGQRVIVQSCLVSLRKGTFTPWLGSERDGAFAEYVVVPAADTYEVHCDFSDAELAAIPCAFGTAENLLTRSQLSAGEHILITGASGNVGLAAVQLAKRRDAEITVVAAREKFAALQAMGATNCLERGASLTDRLRNSSVDLVLDVVGGSQWPELLEVLKTGGRYAVSGAIAGPMVEMDLRTLYLKDLTLFGCTSQSPEVFPNLVGYLERGEIRPMVAASYPLRDIVAAQEAFESKQNVGKIILVP
jgi:NADPH:quinone reductase-like Zn-dependent oxidoreductase